ncbi:MAG: hypothetical protein ACOCT9_02080 [archaeon]
MTTNEDIAKILGVLGAVLGIVDVLTGLSGPVRQDFLNLDRTIMLIIALVISIIALMVSLRPDGLLMIIMGILMIIFASLIGGILVLLGGIIDIID